MADREKFEAWWMEDVPEEHREFAKSLLNGYGPDYTAAAGVADAWSAWKAGRRAALEECRDAVRAEHLGEHSGHAADIAYEQAVDDCEKAIGAIASGDKL